MFLCYKSRSGPPLQLEVSIWIYKDSRNLSLSNIRLTVECLPLCFSVQFSFFCVLNVGLLAKRRCFVRLHVVAGAGPHELWVRLTEGPASRHDPRGKVFPSTVLAHEGK